MPESTRVKSPTDPTWLTELAERGRELADRDDAELHELDDFMQQTHWSVRAKGILDGADDLVEATTRARDFASLLDRLAELGWEIEQTVADDYAWLVPATGTELRELRDQIGARVAELAPDWA